MGVINEDIAGRVDAYIEQYTPEHPVPRQFLVPLPTDEEVISVMQRRYSFSRGDGHYKRYLETLDLRVCIGLTVYDPKTKVGCVAHLDNERGIKPHESDKGLHFLLDLAQFFRHYQSPGPYQIRIVGGWSGLEHSEEILLPLFETLHHLDPFEVVELSVLQPMPQRLDTVNIILDLYDGTLYNSSAQIRTDISDADRLISIIFAEKDHSGIYFLHKDPKGL